MYFQNKLGNSVSIFPFIKAEVLVAAVFQNVLLMLGRLRQKYAAEFLAR